MLAELTDAVHGFVREPGAFGEYQIADFGHVLNDAGDRSVRETCQACQIEEAQMIHICQWRRGV